MTRKILVTAGSRGIGRAVVEAFLARGDHVVATARPSSPSYVEISARSAASAGQLRIVEFDAMIASDYEHLFDQVASKEGQVDVLVNNVGDTLRRSPFAESDDELWVKTFEINVLSAVRCSRLFYPLLKEASPSVVINVASIAARTGGAGDSTHYGAAKAALVALTKGLASEWGKDQIRVVGVAPSAIDTDFQRKHSTEERLAKIVAQTPAGRLGTAEEVAAVIEFLSTSDAGYINGETVFLTGGR
jgi:3-oxoacyl-[acyl-carrier protein] reductase